MLLSKNNSLVIRQVTFKDKGNYECTAKNDYGKANSSFWMDVTDLCQSSNLSLDQVFVLKFKPNLNRPKHSRISRNVIKIVGGKCRLRLGG